MAFDRRGGLHKVFLGVLSDHVDLKLLVRGGVSLKRTKEKLIQLLGQADNRVIAMSGKWGTGKTHLWNEVKSGSGDERVKNALYVSLFGLSSIGPSHV